MSDDAPNYKDNYNRLNEERRKFMRGLAELIANSNTEVQVLFLSVFAKRLTTQQLNYIEEEIENFADEETSIALAALSRAINERDSIETRDLT